MLGSNLYQQAEEPMPLPVFIPDEKLCLFCQDTFVPESFENFCCVECELMFR